MRISPFDKCSPNTAPEDQGPFICGLFEEAFVDGNIMSFSVVVISGLSGTATTRIVKENWEFAVGTCWCSVDAEVARGVIAT